VDGLVAVLLLGTEFAAFVGVALLVIVTPGQDTALTIRNSLLGGRRSGVLTAAGVCTGQCVWVVATSAGLAAVLVASEVAFTALRLIGAGYLCFLGAQALYAAVRGSGRKDVAAGRKRPAFRQGLVSNLGNPKMAVFFSSLLPQFAESFSGLLALGLLFVCMTFVWLSAYAFVVARAGDVFRKPKVKRTLDAVLGVALVAFGVRLAAEPSK
jgi:threonine/homoserine/homoserine lactone efflux protein